MLNSTQGSVDRRLLLALDTGQALLGVHGVDEVRNDCDPVGDVAANGCGRAE